MRLSVLDLAPIAHGQSVGEALHATVAFAQAAERSGFERVWYAEHHNMPTIASSATAVLIAHVAAHTDRIRLGAGGIMLPNHSPLVIAEQFGTLAALHPGRIDLGLGRAPGTDQATFRALRRDLAASDRFPEDVVELQQLLAGAPLASGVRAVPGAGTNVPLTILGSSLFGAQLAAQLGLPYAVASHFAPDLLNDAVRAYRDAFRPSTQLDSPYVIAGFNAIVGESTDDAERMHAVAKRSRVRGFLLRGVAQAEAFSDDDLDAIAASPQAAGIIAMMRKQTVGTGEDAVRDIERFAAEADADEVMLAVHAPTGAERIRALELIAAAR